MKTETSITMTRTHFCEYEYSPHLFAHEYPSNLFGHEPINSISSIAFCIYSLYFIYKNTVNKIQYVMASILFVCGVGSSMFHYTLLPFWRSVDEVSMLWLVTIANIFASSVPAPNLVVNTPLSNIVHFAKTTALFAFLIASTISNILYEKILLFRVHFILSIALFIYLTKNRFSRTTYIVGISGGICWVCDLAFCSERISYMYLHTMWHIFIGYFAYKCLFVFAYIDKN